MKMVPYQLLRPCDLSPKITFLFSAGGRSLYLPLLLRPCFYLHKFTSSLSPPRRAGRSYGSCSSRGLCAEGAAAPLLDDLASKEPLPYPTESYKRMEGLDSLMLGSKRKRSCSHYTAEAGTPKESFNKREQVVSAVYEAKRKQSN